MRNVSQVALNPTSNKTAAAAAAEDEVLIREIDEAVRQDDALTFIRTYGVAILIAILVLIAGLGGWMLWDNHREGELEAQSEALVSALDYAGARDFRSASEKAAPLVAEGTPGVRTSARFILAGAALEQGDEAQAIEHYQAIVADAEAPPALRDLARIREVATAFDRLTADEVMARLRDLAVPGNPYFGSAGELVAMAQLEAGDRAAAGRLFAAIAKDEEQPETLRSRARQMAGLLGVDAIVDVEKLLEAEGVVASDGRSEGDSGAAAVAE